MNSRRVSTRTVILLGVSALLAGLGLALPRVRPVPHGADPALLALRAERAGLAGNDDATLARLRDEAKLHPAPAWSEAQFIAQVGTGWRVEWREAEGATRPVRLTRSAPRMEEWPDYVRFLKTWIAQSGVIFDSLDLTAQGAARSRRFTAVAVSLRIKLAVAPAGDAERAAQSRGPLPVAPAAGPAEARKIGSGPALRRPEVSAEPPPSGPASASFRPDPPGPRAGLTPTDINP